VKRCYFDWATRTLREYREVSAVVGLAKSFVEQFRKIKTITSHIGHSQFLSEVGNPVGYIERPTEIPSPYMYSPFWLVYRYGSEFVVVAETSHKRYEVFIVPAEMVKLGRPPY